MFTRVQTILVVAVFRKHRQLSDLCFPISCVWCSTWKWRSHPYVYGSVSAIIVSATQGFDHVCGEISSYKDWNRPAIQHLGVKRRSLSLSVTEWQTWQRVIYSPTENVWCIMKYDKEESGADKRRVGAAQWQTWACPNNGVLSVPVQSLCCREYFQY